MKNNLSKRMLSIVIIGPIFLFCLVKGGLIFNILCLFLFTICAYEIFKLNLIYTKLILFLIFISIYIFIL